jgi:hypothetical protein
MHFWFSMWVGKLENPHGGSRVQGIGLGWSGLCEFIGRRQLYFGHAVERGDDLDGSVEVLGQLTHRVSGVQWG